MPGNPVIELYRFRSFHRDHLPIRLCLLDIPFEQIAPGSLV